MAIPMRVTTAPLSASTRVTAPSRCHQGASGGEPRFLDVPMNRVVDTFSAVDYRTTLPYVDANWIGAMGICAGAGYSANAAINDRRIKALGMRLSQAEWDAYAREVRRHGISRNEWVRRVLTRAVDRVART